MSKICFPTCKRVFSSVRTLCEAFLNALSSPFRPNLKPPPLSIQRSVSSVNNLSLHQNKDVAALAIIAFLFLSVFTFSVFSSSIFAPIDYSEALLIPSSCTIPHPTRTCLDVSTASTVTIGSGNLIPTSGGTFAYGASSINVKTNAPSFSLALSTNGTASSTQDLSHVTLGSGSNTSIPATSGSFGAEAALGVNTWGFTTDPSPTPTASIWSKVPTSQDPVAIVSAGVSSETIGNTTNVYYGANISTDKTSGLYRGTVVYTVIPAVFPAPTISSVTPIGGSIAGGTSITITGENFYDIVGAYPSDPESSTLPTLTGVTIGDAQCTDIVAVSPTSITCTTPANTLGPKNVIVITEHGSATSTNAFNYTTAPTITSVTTSAGAGVTANYTVKGNGEWPNATLGTNRTDRVIAITGTNFYQADGQVGTAGISISVGGTDCTDIAVTSATTATCTAPNVTKTGNQAVIITTPFGTSTTTFTAGVDAITYVAGPTVSGVAPGTVSTDGGDTVTITGAFMGANSAATSVTVGGVTCVLSGTFTNNSEKTCSSPASAVGVQGLIVYTAYGASTSHSINYVQPLADGMYMQDATKERCEVTNFSAVEGYDSLTGTIRMVDERDNFIYKVKKMADGRCWMAENLAFQLDNAHAPTFDPSAQYGGIFTESRAAMVHNYGYTTAQGYVTTLYNWCAAMADTSAGCSATENAAQFDTVIDGAINGTGDATTQPKATGICPAPFSLPKGGPPATDNDADSTANEFAKLDIAMGGTGANRPYGDTFSLWLGTGPTNTNWLGWLSGAYGSVSGNFDYRWHEESAIYWTSTKAGNVMSYFLNIFDPPSIPGLNNVYTANNNGEYYNYGFAIRCIL